jgi:DNA repair protein RecN (Recombination protein N)
MLRRLVVRNLVLIREADLELGGGVVAVTGETGAGKTIFANAIGLLLGQPAEQGLVGPDGSEAYVEAELDLPDGVLDEEGLEPLRELAPPDEPGLVVARRVFADGRSRAYAWGRAVPRDAVAALGERLIAMSGQFEQRRLARPSHQLELLDAFCGEEQLRARDATAAAWRGLGTARRALAEAEEAEATLAARRGELEALVAAATGLAPDDDVRLAAERERLRRADELTGATLEAAEAIAPEQSDEPGAAERTARAARALERVRGVSPALDEAREALGRAEVELREAASSLRGALAELESEPGRLEAVEERLGAIADARRRFGCADLAELLERAAAAEAELAEGGAEGRLAAARRAADEASERYEQLAAGLREARAGAGGAFAEAVREELRSLGLGDGDLRVELRERSAGPSGRDEVELLVRANAGLPFGPVATTASGGELSRIALALRAVAHASAGEPTVLFDEIDAGVGGVTAHAVAAALRRLAGRAQVIAITHLPQLARVADVHLLVEKVQGDPTHARIVRLDDDERRAELERMLGGAAFLEAVATGRADG